MNSRSSKRAVLLVLGLLIAALLLFPAHLEAWPASPWRRLFEAVGPAPFDASLGR